MKNGRPDLSVLRATVLTLGLNVLLAAAAMAIVVLAARFISGSGLFSFISPTPTPHVVRNHSVREQADSSMISASTQELLDNQTNILQTQHTNLGRHPPKIFEIPPGSNRPLSMGEKRTFWVVNKEDERQYQISAHLAYAGIHIYFWAEDELEYDWDDLYTLAQIFEREIFTCNHDLLGAGEMPGVDRDPHVHILYTSRLGSTTAGYFSNADALPARLHHLSNQHDMIFLNANEIDLDGEYTRGVLAHEYAHMIQWSKDRDEEVWLTEGLAELAGFVNGYRLGAFDAEYAKNPDIPLTGWPGRDGNATPHYGASFLFVDYLWGRFGDQAIRDLVASPANGMDSVKKVLEGLDARDPLTNLPLSTDDLFLDWAIANEINRPGLSKGIYGYPNYPSLAQMQPVDKVVICPSSTMTRSVNQYGVDYVDVLCQGRFNLEFEGTIQTAIFPDHSHAGRYVFWSGKGESLDTTLTRTFDLSLSRPPLTLIFWTWFDLEEESDFVYLLISTNEGENWQTLASHYGQEHNPLGEDFDRGYTGRTNGGRWVQEKIDLSPYAGQIVSLQFRYVTDEMYSGAGFVVDDIAIPEIGYTGDFEDGAGGWQADGFVRVINALPQSFRLALIRAGVLPGVVRLRLQPDNTLKMPLVVDDTVRLVITATNPVTHLPAAYRFRITAAGQ